VTGSDSNQAELREEFKVSDNVSGMKIVEVHWLDSFGIHGWGDRDQRLSESAESFGLNISVGYLLHDGPDWIVLTESISHKHNVGCCTSIPRIAVRNIEVIREGPMV
jgi:hypothetical protein